MAAFEPEPGELVANLDTPSILCDLDRLERNIAEWQAIMDRNQVRFRPHIKTHKIPEIARMQLDAGARGIICAKPSEAEPFVAAGVDDVCIAYPVFGATKWRRIASMAARGVRMTVNCDNQAAAEQASEAALAAGVTINLQIDVDSGMHRGGVPMAEVAEIERLARAIGALPGVEFDGLTTHRGIWHQGSPGPEDAGHDEGRLLVDIVEKLRAAGIEVREVTAGGSFTGKWVADRRVFVERLTEEHGMARAEEPVELGEKLRFYPFHACTCANLTNQIIGFRGDRVETVWTVAARGLRT